MEEAGGVVAAGAEGAGITAGAAAGAAAGASEEAKVRRPWQQDEYGVVAHHECGLAQLALASTLITLPHAWLE